jgi:aryl-alcohol dehydrogenase-like predicted oxidoreductase
MRYRSLGNSGLVVSVVGLGCNNFGRRLDTDATRAVVDAAIEAGVTLLDTAESYGGGGRSEEILGEVLTGRRDQVVLATKFGGRGVDMGYGPAAGAKGGRSYIMRAAEQSLRRLRTDYIDLYQLHTPDPATPIEETLTALGDLVTQGKVRYIGHSNFSGWQLAEAASAARELGTAAFISGQRSCPPPYITALACCHTSRSPTGCSPERSGAARSRPRAAGWPAGAITSPTKGWTRWRR